MPAPSGERATLSRDLADFLIELSIALHKHAMYPEGHPSLAPAAAAVTRRAAQLLEDRATVSLGVARNQLVIEGVATDPKHPVLRELAGRLHRHHLGAITFRRGVEQEEVADALRTLAIEAERTGQPLGLGDRDRLAAWPHVQLHAPTYERLALTDQAGPAGEGDARAAQLWVGLARAALATAPDDTRPTPTEPAVIAQAIDEHSKAEATGYDQVIVGYLLQIAAELKTAGSTEAAALRRRTSRLIRTLKPETLQRLVRMGGDFAQRRQFVSDAADGMAVDAVLDILKAAAESSQEAISHSLVRLLSKLAVHAEAGAAPVRPQADAALREQVQQLLAGWTLPDPNPGAYGAALQRMARAAPAGTPRSDHHVTEPDRLVAMALEIGTMGPRLHAAVDRVVAEGRLAQLLDALEAGVADTAAAATVRARIATAAAVQQIVARESIDFKLLERLVPLGGAARVARAAGEDGRRDRAVGDCAARRQPLVRDAQPARAARRAGAPTAGVLGCPLHAARRRAGALAGGQATAEAPGWSRRSARRRPARSGPAHAAPRAEPRGRAAGLAGRRGAPVGESCHGSYARGRPACARRTLLGLHQGDACARDVAADDGGRSDPVRRSETGWQVPRAPRRAGGARDRVARRPAGARAP